MTFNSFNYFVFFPIVFIIFYLAKHKQRWAVLLMASIFFYATLKAPYLIAMLGLVTLMAFFSGLRLAATKSEGARKSILILTIAVLTLPLIALRYLPYLLQYLKVIQLDEPIGGGVLTLGGLVTLGVSFFTLQVISYIIDIYLEVLKPERHLGVFALYMCFFPKLLQGPIERGGELLPQLHQPYTFDYENIRQGLWQVGWGLVKKLVLADRIALFVNPVYDNVQNFYGPPLILATYLYALQLYFDFSGYTDMALGVARLFNIKLTQNFDRPYLATSIPEFWRRWHISFSRWILDYIFKPLQLWWRNAQAWGTAAALLVTFLFSGVWHGISGGFVAWGLLHGIYMACSALFSQRVRKFLKARKLDKSKVVTALQVFITFNLVCFAWVFFRANSLSDGWYAATHLIYGVPTALRLLWSSLFPSVNSAGLLEFFQPLMLGQDLNSVLTLAGLLAALVVLAILVPRSKDKHFPLGQPTAVRWAIYYLMVLVILFLGAYGSGQVFIYNQF